MAVDIYAERGLPWDRHPPIIDQIDPGDCWEWTGGRQRRDGYGILDIDGRQHYAHRVIWEALVGPIAEGMTLDHLCRNRACVNPDHLEPVTPVENVMRGYSPHAKHARQKRCKYGHPFTLENTWRDGAGYRQCRKCKGR